MKHVLDDIGNACLWASSALILIWVTQYSMLSAWWKHSIGITIVGEALAILAIFIPSLLGLADPASFAHFATTTWYLWLTVGIVVATTVFISTRIVVWELIRRKRRVLHGSRFQFPSGMAERIRELEAEVARLREQP